MPEKFGSRRRGTITVQVRVQANNQVTLPREVRERLGIKMGDCFEVQARGGSIIFVPISPRRK